MSKKINHNNYDKFKKDLKEKFPDYLQILSEVEHLFDFDHLDDDFCKKHEELIKLAKSSDDYATTLSTRALELFIQSSDKI
jgi:hypothetical protein